LKRSAKTSKEKQQAMNLIAANALKTLRLLPRAALILLVLAAPVLAVPAMRADAGSTIDAPAIRKTGVGFVLLVSLQRG
jgi:hypothetical protein